MVLKVCGMRNPENIKQLLKLPIDLMGLIFYERSSRHVPDSAAKEILEASEGKVSRVGVFVNEAREVIIQKVARFKLEYVQLHGKESPEDCYNLLAQSARTFGCADDLKIIKAFSVDEHFDFSILKAYNPYVQYFLFDTKGINPGGNGVTFDWTLLKSYNEKIPFLLAGGIEVSSAKKINQLNYPLFAGVDINSKFETAPALKDIQKISIFHNKLKKEVL